MGAKESKRCIAKVPNTFITNPIKLDEKDEKVIILTKLLHESKYNFICDLLCMNISIINCAWIKNWGYLIKNKDYESHIKNIAKFMDLTVTGNRLYCFGRGDNITMLQYMIGLVMQYEICRVMRLDISASAELVAVIEKLSKMGADPRIRDSYGNTVLHYIAKTNFTDVLDVLMAGKIAPSLYALNNCLESPITRARNYGKMKMVARLEKYMS